MSLAARPFPGLGALTTEIQLALLLEIFMAWTISVSHNPTHSEWPQTGVWQGVPHPVFCHLPNCCPDLEHYLKTHLWTVPSLLRPEGALQTMVDWGFPAS